MLPCVNDLILLKVFQVMYYVVHILDLVGHDKLHPWKTSMAYELFWGKILLCLILFPLLSWGFMFCDTCSVPLLVLCTSHILHVAPMMRDHLVYYE